MPTFNRSEQIVLLLLSAALVVGAVVRVTEHYFTDLPDFQVIRNAVPPPERPSGHPEGAQAPASPSAATARAAPVPVDINSASAPQLSTLPRVGPRTAERIVAFRDAHGPFRSLEDLTGVKGIGDRTLERLRPHIAPIAPTKPTSP